MNPNKMRQLSEIIIKVAKSAVPPSDLGDSPGRMVANEVAAFGLLPDAIEGFQQVLHSLLQEAGWGDKYSEQYLNKRLEHITSIAIRDPNVDSVIRHIQDLEDEYSAFSTTQTVYIPVVGLSLLRPELVLGAVTLLKSTEAVIQTAIESLHRVVDQSPRDENEKKAIKQKFEQQISDNMRDGVFSMFQGVAEPTRALERAEEETRRAIDLLRFVVPAFYPPDQKGVVGLPGEAERVIQWTLVLSDTSFNINRKVVRAIAPFEITDDRIHHMENIGVFEVSRMLRTPERSLNDFEKTILRAIHWFASAQTQDEVENRFLNLITCIETFLTPRDGNPIGTAIAEGLALILGAELETRKRIKRRVQQLYRQRSAVSHGGRKSVLETDFLELESIAAELIVSLIARRNEFNSQKDLLGWIEDRKLG